MISDARAHPPEAEDATGPVDGATPTDDGSVPTGPAEPTDVDADAATIVESPSRRRGRGRGTGPTEGDEVLEDGEERRGPRVALPVLPLLGALLVLLLAAIAFLWFTRPAESDISTADYAEALRAARSGVVDVTSFDHLTIDDDIEQIRRVATGDLREEAVAQLEDRREEITSSEAVVNTEVVGAGVTAADEDSATAALLIQSTQQSNASEQAQVVKYRIQVELEKVDGQWRLSGITGR
ncbi:hypothetical protein [Blastococcus atacamensis]|uniref:hypothetical protein n=1 Tax=Blastococcus atacamensis TaxID=2070508 RepID=UPI000CEC1A80|nr:hypothetical protein [Blastococcus atacamensis]